MIHYFQDLKRFVTPENMKTRMPLHTMNGVESRGCKTIVGRMTDLPCLTVRIEFLDVRQKRAELLVRQPTPGLTEKLLAIQSSHACCHKTFQSLQSGLTEAYD